MNRNRSARLHRRPRPATPTPECEALLVHDRDGVRLHEAAAPVVAELRYTLARLQVQEGKTCVPPVLGVTGSLAGEGTSFVARTLAALMAQDLREPVCLVELNWWSRHDPHPSAPARPGVADVLAGRADVQAVLRATDVDGLAYVPSGAVPSADRPTATREPALAALLEELGTRFTHVVLDLPPVLLTSEALALARGAEACLVVVRQGVTPVDDVRAALDNLRDIGVLGVVMNRASSRIPVVLRRRLPAA